MSYRNCIRPIIYGAAIRFATTYGLGVIVADTLAFVREIPLEIIGITLTIIVVIGVHKSDCNRLVVINSFAMNYYSLLGVYSYIFG